MVIADLEALQLKTRHWLGDERGWDIWYALYSRTGFSLELQTRAASDAHLLLFSPAQIVTQSR
jgi:hypothetical protein